MTEPEASDDTIPAPELGASEDTIPAPEPPSGLRRAPSAGFVGRYQLCFELASGGMAKVYLARITGIAGFEKLVALKRIHSHLADQEEFVEMFLDEARIASRIDHPNVCTVFDFGHANGDYYIAMEFLLGETVARLIKTAAANPGLVRSPRWTALVLRIGAEVCEGLHAAHELRNAKGELLNVVHRDVSPHNLFVGYDGSVKIVDFGIARAAHRLHVTQVGTIKGRHAYMAPEQADGRTVDRRADIWSVGVIMFEALTGKRLFRRATDTDTLIALMKEPIPKLSDVWPEAPPEVEALVMKALERDPEERWPTARKLGRRIERCLMGLEEPAGKAEVADLMEELFPEAREERKRMVDDARTMPAGEVRRVLDDSSPLAVEPVALGADVEPTRLARRRKRLSMLALGVGVAGGVLLTLAVTRSASPEPSGEGAAGAEAVAGAEAAAATEAAAGAEAVAATEAAPEAAAVAAAEAVAATEAAPEAAAAAATEAAPEAAAVAAAAAAAEAAAAPEAASASASEAGSPTEQPRARSRRRGRAPARSLDPGIVSVVTPGGWADVYLGGRKIGRSPGRFELPAGRRTLVLRPFGSGDAQRVSVSVPSGGQARVSVRVER